jgi:hypothetical protein
MPASILYLNKWRQSIIDANASRTKRTRRVVLNDMRDLGLFCLKNRLTVDELLNVLEVKKEHLEVLCSPS